MKNLLLSFFILTTLVACDPEETTPSPETIIPPKIRVLRMTSYGATTTFSFQYNEDTSKLTSVLRNGELFASLTYGTNEVEISMPLNLFYDGLEDTLIVKHTSSGYVDSIYSYNKSSSIGTRYDYYTSVKFPNGKLFSAYNDLEKSMTTNPGRANYSQINHDTSSNNTQNCISDGIVFAFNRTFRDTFNYDLTRVNQPNLPDQFVISKSFYSIGQGLPKLNPLFLLQQSNIYPHKPHTNLISSINMHESGFDVTYFNYFDTALYNYTFDARSRVIEMSISGTITVPITYQIEYFD